MNVLLQALIAFALLVQALLASPVTIRSPYLVRESHVVPHTWKIGKPDPNHLINLKIGLKQGNFAKLEKHLYEGKYYPVAIDDFLTFSVSDPDHQRYGQYLSRNEVEDLVRPNVYTTQLVTQWLGDNGINPSDCGSSPSGDWLTVALPVAKVEALLQTKYSIYQHTGGDTLVRTTNWHLPAHLHDHIRTIQPTTVFLRASPKLSHALAVPDSARTFSPLPANDSGTSSVCDFDAITPTCLRTLYNTLQYAATGKGTVEFNDFLGQVPNRSDTESFLQNFRPEAVASAWRTPQVSVAGGLTDDGTDGAGTEANLDFQIIAGMTWPLNITSVSIGGSPPFNPDLSTPTDTNEPYLTWLSWALSQQDLPSVISTSYGDDEQSVPLSYAVAVCNDLAQLGARGISLLFSSGDNGVGFSAGRHASCVSNDGKQTPRFIPVFPASCPYVTAVGGTRNFPEVVASDIDNGFVSGSGFSNYFFRPSYQNVVVETYLANLGGENAGLYNATGRAYPDIAAQSYHFTTIFENFPRLLDGTSCAAPTAASLIALINDMLLANGRPVLGFLNPWLYTKGHKGFNDIVNGSSSGCGTTGFGAGPGWDVASGFGTPNFEAIGDVLFPEWGANRRSTLARACHRGRQCRNLSKLEHIEDYDLRHDSHSSQRIP